MKAVNLIPSDLRKGRAAPGRAGVGVYVLLGALAMALVMLSALALTTRSLSSKQTELSQLQVRQQAAQATADRLQVYTRFTDLRQKRLETVQQLADSRFDWAHAMHELSRVLPSYAWLTSIRATTSPATNLQGGTADPLRGSLPVPAIELTGCAGTQSDVARVMSALRQADGVQRVSLSSSKKADQTPTSSASSSAQDSAGASGGTDCGSKPKFSLTMFYEASASVPAASATAAAGTTSATGTTPAAGTTSTPPVPAQPGGAQ
jgi:Tfp pilus assembly protein PilN